MTQGGFYEPRRLSPTSLALVVAIHAAALGALLTAKQVIIAYTPPGPTRIYDVPDIIPPDVEPDPRPRERDPISLIDRPTRIIDTPIPTPAPPGPPTQGNPPSGDTAGEAPPTPLPPPPQPLPPPPLPPVRVDAQVDPRFAGDLQPPYPTSEERAEREGRVVIRVTIGADGRVKATERVSATSDAFWRSTDSHARARWRFRPATLDGRPVESVKQMTVHFQLRDRLG